MARPSPTIPATTLRAQAPQINRPSPRARLDRRNHRRHAKAMRRIVILGNAGSGKSTLARRLGARLGFPVVHLDVLFWEPDWKEPDNEAFRARVGAAIAGDAWVSDGNYLSRTFDLRLPRADLVIWLDTPRLTCLWRVLVRSALARPRPDLPAGCEERLFDREFLDFLAHNKKWWLLPIVAILLLLGVLILLSSTAAAPFIYTLF